MTHNLEVPGSSPGWSTLKISNLEEIQVADFFKYPTSPDRILGKFIIESEAFNS